MRKFLGPVDLSRAQTFRIYKLSKIVIVGKYKNLYIGSFLDSTFKPSTRGKNLLL